VWLMNVSPPQAAEECDIAACKDTAALFKQAFAIANKAKASGGKGTRGKGPGEGSPPKPPHGSADSGTPSTCRFAYRKAQ
jgi:hypothetical protein